MTGLAVVANLLEKTSRDAENFDEELDVEGGTDDEEDGEFDLGAHFMDEDWDSDA